MRKTKKWLLAGIALILIGAIVWLVGMSALKWDFYALDTADYEEKNWTTDEEVARVEIDVDSFPLIVQKGDGVSLTYYEAEDDETTVSVSGGTLTVKNKAAVYNLFRAGMFQLKRSKCKWVLTVPDGIDLSVKSANGDIRVSDMTLPTVELRVTNLDAVLVRCNIESLTVSGTNADIIMNECHGNTVDMHATNLDARITQSQFASVQMRGTNIDVKTVGVTCEQMELHGTNADFELRNLTVHTLSVKGTNLDVDMTIAGNREEYTVEGSGKYAQTGTTDKRIEISGLNKDVKLRFV